MEPTATLHGWSLERGYHGYIIAKGRIYNDKKGRFSDGDYIVTSPIEELDIEGNLVQTRNTLYRLA